MRLIKLSFLCILFLRLFLFEAEALPKESSIAEIKGRVLDSISGQPVEYASISLAMGEAGVVVNGTTADAKGEFSLSGIKEGRYTLSVYFMGYDTYVITDLLIAHGANLLNLGALFLVRKALHLKEVNIISQKNFIENKLDKMVYNVENDITAQGGVATDILKKIPQVAVDVDGNIELQGNSNIRFLINGKPSGIFGNNIADVLQTIPSSQIQSIEVITSPGARYDAEGTGGIINIILKKNEAKGMHGNVSLSGGTRFENGSFNLSGGTGKLSLNAFLNGNAQLISVTPGETVRRTNEGAQSGTSVLNQNGQNDFSRNGYQSGIGFGWVPSKGNDVNGSISLNRYGNTTTGKTFRQFQHEDIFGNQVAVANNTIDAENAFHSQTYDWSLNYKKTFKKEEQLFEIVYTGSSANNYAAYSQIQRPLSQDLILNASKGYNPGLNTLSNYSINYAQPLAKNILLETGAKSGLEYINNIAEVYLLNPRDGVYTLNAIQSVVNKYQRAIYAGYLSGTFKLKYMEVKAGARVENTRTVADFSNAGKVIIPDYTVFVPSFVISVPVSKTQTIKLNYAHRIQRPGYRDLNPFINASDPKNISTGNPYLTPEIVDNIELGYNKYFEKEANLNASIFYRGNRDDIQSFTHYYPSFKVGDSIYTNVAVNTRENIGLESNYGLNIFFYLPVRSKIQLRSNTSFYQRNIINNLEPSNNTSGFNYRLNLNGNYQITAKTTFELFVNYTSKKINVQGTMPSFFTYNMALRKLLWNKRASLALTATNPFNQYVAQETRLTGQNFTLYNLRELPYRSFGINFTCKFGKIEFKKEKAAEDTTVPPPPPAN